MVNSRGIGIVESNLRFSFLKRHHPSGKWNKVSILFFFHLSIWRLGSITSLALFWYHFRMIYLNWDGHKLFYYTSPPCLCNTEIRAFISFSECDDEISPAGNSMLCMSLLWEQLLNCLSSGTSTVCCNFWSFSLSRWADRRCHHWSPMADCHWLLSPVPT